MYRRDAEFEATPETKHCVVVTDENPTAHWEWRTDCDKPVGPLGSTGSNDEGAVSTFLTADTIPTIQAQFQTNIRNLEMQVGVFCGEARLRRLGVIETEVPARVEELASATESCQRLIDDLNKNVFRHADFKAAPDLENSVKNPSKHKFLEQGARFVGRVYALEESSRYHGPILGQGQQAAAQVRKRGFHDGIVEVLKLLERLGSPQVA